MLLFCVSRDDTRVIEAAEDIDPDYARTLREVAKAGVEVLAYRARLSEREITLGERVEVGV